MVRPIIKRLFDLLVAVLRAPRSSLKYLSALPESVRGVKLAATFPSSPLPRPGRSPARETAAPTSPVEILFEAIDDGPGIWKWRHYFDIYHRHLSKFIDGDVEVVEVGVYSGGSLRLWKRYFGAGCHVSGVDIHDACRIYENESTTIYVGDQADREFWRRFREQVPIVDVFIDDGGHRPEEQMVTLEEMLPHLRPGGVYICEDIHGTGNRFATFAYSLADNLNALIGHPRRDDLAMPTPFQAAIRAVHLYPFALVIEKTERPVDAFESLKRGTEWQPFL